MVSLSLHESNPGHHLQNSYSLEQQHWPMFRKVTNRPTDRAFTIYFLSLRIILLSYHQFELMFVDFCLQVKEDRIYSQSPSRFPINTGYGEGWGLYSESLGFDMGLYDDPMDRWEEVWPPLTCRYGHLSEEIFRACRLVVDTGMHALGWTQVATQPQP